MQWVNRNFMADFVENIVLNLIEFLVDFQSI